MRGLCNVGGVKAVVVRVVGSIMVLEIAKEVQKNSGRYPERR